MPLRLDIKRKLTARSDRVKSVDLHPAEPWMVVALYSGTVVVWNHATQTMVKTFEACDLPVRVAKFVARKHWILTGADDLLLSVFNYNTLERVHRFEAHADYIRSITVHPAQPYVLTCSDDMLIKLWDWDRKWSCSQVFQGHLHYVMEVVFNPKDNNQFASASLDRTIKVWQLGSSTPNFTLEGHRKGVNCIDYYSGGDKPYLISGADDHLVKIWDYQNKTCVQTLEGHVHNVTCVAFHPELPVILTGSEDGTVRVWHSNTYRLENTLNYGMDRAWCLCGQAGSNSVAVGYDDGSIIIKLGREEPAMSMDSSGKVLWARHSEVQQANLKAMGDAELRDGERLPLAVKDMGSCDIYPQTLQHSPNGRFVVVCGDGEYIIYTAMALRNKSFGSAQEFVWAHDSSQYAISEGKITVKIFKNFKERMAFKPDHGAEGIFGGFLLGVRSKTGLAFYDWESTELIRRIEIQPKHVIWSDSAELVCVASDESFFVLRYLPEKVAAAQESKDALTEDGIEDSFEVLGEVPEVVKTGIWVGDCFIYTSSLNRLNYYVGGEIVTITHLDRAMYLLGYIPKDDRIYLGDKELNIISYSLMLSVLEYQTAVMRRDFRVADRILPTIPKEQRMRVAYFLEKQGFKQQALAVTPDPEHKFDLALQLGEVNIAYQLALEAEAEQKWKQLAELATTKSQFSLAQECLHHAQDYGGLLLLATASGSADMVGKLAEGAERNEKTNVAFLTYFLQGRLDKCLELLIQTDRLPEAAFLARTYLPSHVSRVVRLWKESLAKVNQKAADALADPTEYSNLFPGLRQALLAEAYLKETSIRVRPAADYPLVMHNEDRNVLEESKGFSPRGEITEPEAEVESTIESVVAAAVTEAVGAETAVVDELIPLKEEFTDPALKKEEPITTLASSPPVTVAEEPMELKQVEYMSSKEEEEEKEEEADNHPEEDVAQSEEAITGSEKDVTHLEEAITGSEKDVTHSEEAITGSEKDVTHSEEAITGSEKDVTHSEEAITGSEKDVTHSEEAITGSEKDVTHSEEAITGSEKDITHSEEAIAGSEEVITGSEKDVTHSEEAITGSEKDVTHSEEAITGSEKDVTHSEEAITGSGEAMNRSEEAITGSEEAITGSEEAITGSEKDVTLSEEAITGSEKDVTLSEEAITGSEKDVTLSEEAITGSEEDVTRSKEDITRSEEAVTHSEEASDCVPESTTEINPTEPVMAQSSPMEDVSLMIETDVQNISPATDTGSVANEMMLETITIEESPSETVAQRKIAAEDLLFSTDLTEDTDVTELLACGEIPAEELGTDVMSSEAPFIIDTVADKIGVTEELSGTAPLAVPEQLISFENTASPAQNGSVQIQTLPLASYPLLDPLGDTTPVLKPATAQEQGPESPEHPVQPEDKQEPLQVEPEVLSAGEAPAEGIVLVPEDDLEGAEDPADDFEAELTEEVLDELDLDSLDVENIDTSDVDLDEDFLYE